MTWCALANCLGVVLGAVTAEPLSLPPGISLAGYGSLARRDLLTTFLPFRRFSRFFKASVGLENDGVRVGVLVLRDQNLQAAFISLETVAVTKEMRADLLQSLAEEGIGLDKVYLTATHTHSGPGGLSHSLLWELAASDQYLPGVWDQTRNATVHLVKKTLAQMQPVQLMWGAVESKGLTHNRRSLESNDRGHTLLLRTVEPVSEEGARERHSERHSERHLETTGERPGDQKSDPAAKAKPSSRVLGGVILFPVHGTAWGPSNLKLSGDLPGALAREVEKSYPRSHFLFFSEAAADLVPKKNRAEGITELSQQFAKDFVKQEPHLELLSPQFSISERSVSLGHPRWKAAGCGTKLLSGLSVGVGKFFPDRSLIESFSFGKIKWDFFPGEVTSTLAKANPSHGSISVTLANDYLGYFVSPEEYQLGGYESCVTFYGQQGGLKLLGEN